MKKVHLLLIDPQNDFMDQPKAALAVPGAQQDMKNVAELITRMNNKLSDIHVTLDSHHVLDVAHPAMWRDANNNMPNPFTEITHADVKNGVWMPFHPALKDEMLAYTKELEVNNRYKLLIWPEHCLIGSWGNAIYEPVIASLNIWARENKQLINYVTKGSNPFTEHYSAVKAEVQKADDKTTQINWPLINVIKEADLILLAGEALSHCVASTVTDIADNFGEENISKLVLLTDCASSVTGFETNGQEFIEKMVKRGMKTALSTDFF